MAFEVEIANGCADVAAGKWLVHASQPAAFSGRCRFQGLPGFVAPDRAALRVLTAEGRLKLSASAQPFLTHIPCAAPLTVVSDKLLVAPFAARVGGKLLKLIPLSMRSALRVTRLEKEWAVVATKSRTTRVALAEGEDMTVSRGAAVAWTTRDPTGFCPRLRLRDLLLPRLSPGALMMSFYGPGVVWMEGA